MDVDSNERHSRYESSLPKRIPSVTRTLLILSCLAEELYTFNWIFEQIESFTVCHNRSYFSWSGSMGFGSTGYPIASYYNNTLQSLNFAPSQTAKYLTCYNELLWFIASDN